MMAIGVQMRRDPSPAEIASLEAEWPVLEAELALVAAECRLAERPTDQLTIRAHRRAVRALLAVLAGSPSDPRDPLHPFNPLASGIRPDAA